MPITKRTPIRDVVSDFKKSKAPQFKGKSKAKRREMAIAAALSKRDGKKMTKEELKKLDRIKATNELELEGNRKQNIKDKEEERKKRAIALQKAEDDTLEAARRKREVLKAAPKTVNESNTDKNLIEAKAKAYEAAPDVVGKFKSLLTFGKKRKNVKKGNLKKELNRDLKLLKKL